MLISPLNQQDAEKQTLVNRLIKIKDTHQLSNYKLAEACDVHEKTIRNWLGGLCLPSELHIPRIIKALDAYSDSYKNAYSNAYIPTNASTHHEGNKVRTEANPINKEMKNIDVSGRNNVDNVGNVDTSKTKKSKKPSTKKKSIDFDNPCSSCPAYKEKDKRFVDGEGSDKNQPVVVVLKR